MWLATVQGLRNWYRYADASLTEEEQMRCQRYAFRDGAERFVLGRFLLRMALAAWPHSTRIDQHLLEQAAQLKFEERLGNAPALKNAPAFSLSRSGHYLFVGVGEVQALGVDVEMNGNAELVTDAMARNFFSEEELRQCNELQGNARATRLLQAWTGKEAIVKAAGIGLHAPLREIVLSGEQILSLPSLSKIDSQCRLRLIDEPEATLAIAWW